MSILNKKKTCQDFFVCLQYKNEAHILKLMILMPHVYILQFELSQCYSGTGVHEMLTKNEKLPCFTLHGTQGVFL